MNNSKNFDPIDFLGLTNLTKDEQEFLRPKIYINMVQFLINEFLESLNEDEIYKLGNEVKQIKTYEDSILIFNKYDPNFNEKKGKYLQKYKENFDLENFKGKQ